MANPTVYLGPKGHVEPEKVSTLFEASAGLESIGVCVLKGTQCAASTRPSTVHCGRAGACALNCPTQGSKGQQFCAWNAILVRFFRCSSEDSDSADRGSHKLQRFAAQEATCPSRPHASCTECHNPFKCAVALTCDKAQLLPSCCERYRGFLLTSEA